MHFSPIPLTNLVIFIQQQYTANPVGRNLLVALTQVVLITTTDMVGVAIRRVFDII